LDDCSPQGEDVHHRGQNLRMTSWRMDLEVATSFLIAVLDEPNGGDAD